MTPVSLRTLVSIVNQCRMLVPDLSIDTSTADAANLSSSTSIMLPRVHELLMLPKVKLVESVLQLLLSLFKSNHVQLSSRNIQLRRKRKDPM